MSEALGGTAVRIPEPRHRRPVEPMDEPTGQWAIVADAFQVPFVRIGHRWYRAGDVTTEPVLWPLTGAVELISRGQS